MTTYVSEINAYQKRQKQHLSSMYSNMKSLAALFIYFIFSNRIVVNLLFLFYNLHISAIAHFKRIRKKLTISTSKLIPKKNHVIAAYVYMISIFIHMFNSYLFLSSFRCTFCFGFNRHVFVLLSLLLYFVSAAVAAAVDLVVSRCT